MTKLEFVAELGISQLEVVPVYTKGLLTFTELMNLIGKSKAMLVENFTKEYVRM